MVSGSKRPFWSAQPLWKGETIVLVGGGPSLRDADLEPIAGYATIAINNAWELKRDADILYFSDAPWWTSMKPKSEDLAHYSSNRQAAAECLNGIIVTGADEIDDAGVNRLKLSRTIAFSRDPSTLAHGANSGYQAINLAALLGAARIVLLGFDMAVEGDDTHWHDGHLNPGQSRHEYRSIVQNRLEKIHAPRFEALVEPLVELGIEVVHGTPTAMPHWPVRPLAEILRGATVYTDLREENLG